MPGKSIFRVASLVVIGAGVALLVVGFIGWNPLVAQRDEGLAGTEERDEAGGSGERPYVGGDFHTMAVHPKDPQKVMVGGHASGALSEDGGKTWQQVADLNGASAMAWVIDPSDPQKMYIAGHPGFYRSDDGGKSWSLDNSGLPSTDMHGLGMDPNDPNVLYAYLVGSGIYRSGDAGKSWELINNDEMVIMGPILVDPRDSDTLYLAEIKGGAFQKSTDGGKTWRQLSTIPGDIATWVSQDPSNPDTFYAAGGGAVFKSTDGGESWRPSGDGLPEGRLPEAVWVVAVSPSDPQVVYAGVLEGTQQARVFRSEDGGESWEARN